jgi:biopolymer transport protein TolR
MKRIHKDTTRHHGLRRRPPGAGRRPGLSLVALMDVFTILVFFFLVHSTDGMVDAHGAQVNLPASIAERQPAATLVVTITPGQVLVQGEPVVELDADTRNARGEIQGLLSALRSRQAADPSAATDQEVTIMGDRSIPFALLNRVMQTCAGAGYDNISLSVQQRTAGAG